MRPSVRVRWFAGAPDPAWRALLTTDEQARLDGMGSEDAANGFLTARWLLRHLLTDMVPSVAPDQWRLATQAAGKPFVDLQASGADRPIEINLTHTNGLAAVAASFDVAVGIDAEHLGRQAKLDRLIARYFTAGERAWLQPLSDDERRQRFFDVWTLKEAAIKMRGGALGRDIGTVEVLPGVGPVNLRPSNSDTTTYRRWKVPAGQGEALVVLAVDAPGADVVSKPMRR